MKCRCGAERQAGGEGMCVCCGTCGTPGCECGMDDWVNSACITSIQEIAPGARFSFYEQVSFPVSDGSEFWRGVFVLTSKTHDSGVWTILFDPIYDQPLKSGFVSEISAVVKDNITLYLIEGESE